MRFHAVVLCALLALPALADRAADWRADIKTLESELRRVHPRFRECGAPSFDALAARVQDLSDPQIVVALQQELAKIGDGHTLLWPFGMKRGVLLKIPVMLWWFDEGLYVVDGEYSGRRVMKIGSMNADDVLAKLEPLISHDNKMQLAWAAPFYATMTDFLVAIGATSDRTSVVLTFDDQSTVTLGAAPVDPETLELRLVPAKRRGETFRTEEIAPGVLYIAVNSMSEPLVPFGRELNRKLVGYDRAILDLRLNNGGEASQADGLMKSLIAFDARGGKLVTLISRMTFSAAQTFASRLDQWTDTIFIGEPTGSKPNHFGNERPFKLPNSGVRGTISSGWNQPVTAHDVRQTITPEIMVPQLARDYFAGKDPVLDRAIEHLGARLPTPPIE